MCQENSSKWVRTGKTIDRWDGKTRNVSQYTWDPEDKETPDLKKLKRDVKEMVRAIEYEHQKYGVWCLVGEAWVFFDVVGNNPYKTVVVPLFNKNTKVRECLTVMRGGATKHYVRIPDSDRFVMASDFWKVKPKAYPLIVKALCDVSRKRFNKGFKKLLVVPVISNKTALEIAFDRSVIAL